MQQSRRSFLTAVTCATTSFAVAAETQPFRSKTHNRIKLGISSYSYWHFKTAKVPIETVIDKAAELGVQ